MAYAKFVVRNGNSFGPYYYTSVREGDKVRSVYLGKAPPNKSLIRKLRSRLQRK